jgi:hypothetical protein
MSTSFITPGHVRAFQAATTQLYGEVTLATRRIMVRYLPNHRGTSRESSGRYPRCC